LQKQTHVPIGIIDNSWGGTPLAAFTSMTAIGKDPSLMPQFAAWGRMMEHEGTTLLKIDKEKRDLEVAVLKAKAAGRPVPAATWHATPEAWSPAAIYNGMVAPVTQYAIAGVIWYQGESDADTERAGTYARLFRTMITDWRAQWQVGDFPFLYVQLPNYDAGAGNAWPELREAQLETLQVKNTGMAIALDVGTADNIHPTHKQEVGRRLSLLARAMTTGEHIEDEGPLFRTAQRDGAGVRVSFDHAGELSAKGGAPQTFELAGSDGKYLPASAVIQGQSVYLSAEAIASPQSVRYAWNANPIKANLYNGDGLPASPFRSPVKQ
jgi:sialate O-acetylesterase